MRWGLGKMRLCWGKSEKRWEKNYIPHGLGPVLTLRMPPSLVRLSLAASPTSVVAPSSSESRSDSDVADPNQNISRPKAPTVGK